MSDTLAALEVVGNSPTSIEHRRRLRPKHVAEIYSISVYPVYHAIYRGELPAQKFRRTWLIKPEDAERWIEESSTSNVA